MGTTRPRAELRALDYSPPLNFGSICSGIEAASVAWLPLGWRCQFMSEIEPFPRAVLTHHYPEAPLHGDFTTIKAREYRPIDVLVGGTPYQSFSVAGLRGGMADERGNLALEYLRLVDRLRPRWVVWENVPGVLSSGGGRDFGAFAGGLAECGYGWAYRVLDAQYLGLAQRRKRVFVVGYLGDWRRAAAVLFEPASLRGDPAPSREAGKETTGSLAARTRSGGGLGTDFDCDGGLIANTLRVPSHGATWRGDGCDNMVSMSLNAHGGCGRMDGESETFIATALRARDLTRGVDSDCTDTLITHSLRADGFDASEDGTGRGTPLVAFQDRFRGDDGRGYDRSPPSGEIPGALETVKPWNVAGPSAMRRLTPRECCRLQGFSDDYLDIIYRGKPAADGPKYKALGNSMAVPCMAWIGRRIGAQSATS